MTDTLTKDYTTEEVLDYSRSCDGCVACCTGTLTANIYGFKMTRDQPCHFKLDCSCAIYDKRPQLCKDYTCAWLTDTTIPEWMAPRLSNVILTRRVIKDIPYYTAHETVERMDTKTLSWLVHWALRKGKNLSYTIDGSSNLIGSDEFLAAYNNN